MTERERRPIVRYLKKYIIIASLAATSAIPGADPEAPAEESSQPPPPPAPEEGLPSKTVQTTNLSAERAAEESPIQFSLPSPINDLEKAINYPIDGTFTNRYRLRLTDSDSDQELIQVLSLRAGNPQKNKISGTFLGRLSEDIDGQPHQGSYDPFGEITDTYDSNVNGRFYLGHVDLRHFAWMDRSGLDTIRGGRQSFDESVETFIFDGGRIDTQAFEKLKDLRLTAYGGLPVHYFESSASGDAVAGAGAEVAPLNRTRLRADYTYIQDVRAGFDDGNHLASFALWQGFGERFRVHGRYNLLDGESRDYRVRGTFTEPEKDLLLQASFHHLLMTLQDLSTELNPYYTIMQEYEPFWELDLRASKGLGEHFVLDGGVSFRELVNDDDESTFNHEFQRYYLTPSSRNWPFEGMSIALTGEIWNSPGDKVNSLGGEISQRFLKVLLASFGTFYSLYKVDFLSGEERTNDRTFYWKLEYQLLKDLKLTGIYALERDDISTYHTVDVGLRYSF